MNVLHQIKSISGMIALASLALCPISQLSAQPEDFNDPLQKEMNELFEKLQREGDPSVPKDRDSIHEMSPRQFEQFQQKFLERFFNDSETPMESELRDSIGESRTALGRQAAEIRNRQIGAYERQNESELRQYTSIVQAARISTVSVQADGKAVALGTVIDSAGSILTKLSELDGAKKISCIFANGQSRDAELIGKNKEYDLAMLYVNGVTTTPVQWSENAEVGSTVITADQTGKPLFIGTVSVPPRSLVGSNLAFLGVGPGPHSSGVSILSVESQTAADRAGLKVGDVITNLADVQINSVASLVNTIRSKRPGASVTIQYVRDGARRSTEAILDTASMPGDRELRIQLMNRMGAIPSRRHNEIPLVLQHDAPLLPEKCGGPLVDLDGKAVGLNIARGGRTDSYAIPAIRVKQLIQRLKASQN